MPEEILSEESVEDLKLNVVLSGDGATRAAGRLAMTDLLPSLWAWVKAEQARGTNLNDLMNGLNGFVGATYASLFEALGIENDDGMAGKSVAKSILHVMNDEEDDDDE